MDNRRKTIIVNRSFQHRFAVVLVALTVLLCNLVILFKLLLPGDNPLVMSTSAALSIGIIELILVVGVWYASLRASHRIAGPVYVFTRELRTVGEGNLTARISLREQDMFSEAAQDINASLEQLAGRVERVKSAARELQAAQAAGADCSARLDELLTELDSLRTQAEG